MGVTNGQVLADWNRDITLAKAAKIDGFAINAGPNDAWSVAQLNLAYQSAEANAFKLFISFDMVSGNQAVWNHHKNRVATDSFILFSFAVVPGLSPRLRTLSTPTRTALRSSRLTTSLSSRPSREPTSFPSGPRLSRALAHCSSFLHGRPWDPRRSSRT